MTDIISPRELTHLYRHFDENGTLLYVGISFSAVARYAQHRNQAHWSDDVRTITIEVFPTRQEAEAAEVEAIRKECPLHNHVHNRATAPAHAEVWHLLETQEVSVSRGRLVVEPSSGEKPVPSGWLEKHSNRLVGQIARRLDIHAWQYAGYEREERYVIGGEKKPLISLRLLSMDCQKEARASFTADIRTKAGHPLPERQFRVSRYHALTKFWCRSTGLEPPRLCDLHERMDDLRGLYFTGYPEPQNNQVHNLDLLEVPADKVRKDLWVPF